MRLSNISSELCVLQDGFVHNADSQQVALEGDGMRDAIAKASTAAEMHAAIGIDCWVVVPIDSPSQPDQTLEGTRLTLVCHGLQDLDEMTSD